MPVADIINLWLLEINVVNLAAHRTITPARHPFLKQLTRKFNVDCLNRLSLLYCQLI
jgi:hypothetical protein